VVEEYSRGLGAWSGFTQNTVDHTPQYSLINLYKTRPNAAGARFFSFLCDFLIVFFVDMSS
jgi:hypothetical protein